ncbi:MAG TPA: DUF4333 domain-containing protein, partial [Mycobacterium sp.]
MFKALPRIALAAIAAPVLSLTACNFSFSAGGPNYDELETSIADELKDSYSEISPNAPTVTCPRSQPTPKPGGTFICNADVDGEKVRVEVTVEDDEGNVKFSTLDVVYDLPRTEQLLASEIESQMGFPVTVTCGTGLKIVPVGDSFTCTAADENSVEKTVEVTAVEVGKDNWRIVD